MKEKKKIKQINNLSIYYSYLYSRYQVWTPDGRCWEEFDELEEAENYCRETKDFIKRA